MDPRATGEYARPGRGIAYTSSFWLDPSSGPDRPAPSAPMVSG